MTLRSASTGDTLVLTIERPPVNALDLPTIEVMRDAFTVVAQNPPRAGLVLTGGGDKAFSAGVDVQAFEEYDEGQRRAVMRAITGMTAALLSIPCPVVAAVNGHALGDGFVLMLACDHRLAPDSKTARFGLLEAQAGVPFPSGPLEIIRSELPPTLLRRWTLASTVVSSGELLAAGVVDALHRPKMVLYEALKAATALAPSRPSRKLSARCAVRWPSAWRRWSKAATRR